MALTLGVNSGFVTVAPTADPAETGTTIDGSSVVTKHTSPAGAIKITSIGWYRASGTNTANWEVALYSDAAGVAGARLFVDATNSTSSNGWVTTAVDWAISPGTAYWLGLQMDAHSGSSSVDGAASGGAGSDVLTSQTALNDPYGGGAVADADGMYAIYALVSISHAASGALVGPGSAVSGSAARTSPAVSHATSGALSGQGSTVAGSAARTRQHAASGVLVGPGASLAGESEVAGGVEHATSGALVGSGSELIGAAVHSAVHDTSGDLVGQGSELSGSASLPASAATGPTPAGRSSGRKRKWVIGNRTFYGTADEAADFADVHELPDPEPAKKKPPKVQAAPIRVEEPLKPVPEIVFAPMQGLEFGLLDGSLARQALMDGIGEQIAALRRAQLQEDDEDVLLLLWH